MVFVKFLRRQKPTLFFAVLLTTATFSFYAWKLTDIFESKARLKIMPYDSRAAQDETEREKIKRRTNVAMLGVVADGSFFGQKIEQYDLYNQERASGATTSDIHNKILKSFKVEPIETNEGDSIQISYRDQNPEEAKKVVTALTNGFLEMYSDLRQEREQITVEEAATFPQTPAEPGRLLLVAYGICCGAVLGLMLSLAFEALRWRAAKTNLP